MGASGNIAGASRAYTITTPVYVFLGICPVMVALRFWCRTRKSSAIGAEDWFILASLVCSLAEAGVLIAGCYYGYGQHVANLSHDNKLQALMYFYLSQIPYKISINLTKLSILFFYLRVFGNVKWFRWTTIVVIGLVATYCVVCEIVTIFQCTPVQRAWNKALDGTCIDTGKFWDANAGYSIATDIIILLTPMPLVYKLQIPKFQKIALMGVFALGVFVIITSCLRVTTLATGAAASDSTWEVASEMWTNIEMNVAIVCACLPQVRPLIVKIFPRLGFQSNSRGNTTSNGKTGHGTSTNFSRSMLTNPGNGEDSHNWTRIDDGKDVIHMATIRKGDTSSEEYILQDDKATHGHIQKTVQYSVEYSKEGPSQEQV